MTQRPVAESDHVTQAWWDATRRATFLVQTCEGCAHRQHYPRALCTACGSTRLGWTEGSGRATVYSFTIVRRAPHPAFDPPYVVALLRLDEGPTILSTIVRGEPKCDARATLEWEDLPDGRKLPVFAME
ncbi:MAG: Zn-ribbon domain-containing OB-fold protein [Actinomycetota bacterium]